MLNNFYKLLIFLFLSSLSVISYAWQISGEVVDVHDGDTIIVVDDDKGYKRIIRLSAIDAPELLQSFGKESKNHLLEVSLGRQIQADCYRTIRARVEICRVQVGDLDLAVAQLEAGFAWRYRLYSDGHNPKYRFLYAKAEKLAEEEKKDFGLHLQSRSLHGVGESAMKDGMTIWSGIGIKTGKLL